MIQERRAPLLRSGCEKDNLLKRFPRPAFRHRNRCLQRRARMRTNHCITHRTEAFCAGVLAGRRGRRNIILAVGLHANPANAVAIAAFCAPFAGCATGIAKHVVQQTSVRSRYMAGNRAITTGRWPHHRQAWSIALIRILRRVGDLGYIYGADRGSGRGFIGCNP